MKYFTKIVLLTTAFVFSTLCHGGEHFDPATRTLVYSPKKGEVCLVINFDQSGLPTIVWFARRIEEAKDKVRLSGVVRLDFETGTSTVARRQKLEYAEIPIPNDALVQPVSQSLAQKKDGGFFFGPLGWPTKDNVHAIYYAPAKDELTYLFAKRWNTLPQEKTFEAEEVMMTRFSPTTAMPEVMYVDRIRHNTRSEK